MRTNKSLLDRALNIASINDNAVMTYHKLISLIDHYNELAKAKGLPIKSIPIYNNHLNHALISQMIISILKDIDRIKRIKEEKEEEKTATGVVFTTETIPEWPDSIAWKDDGLWYYIQDGDNIYVYADTDAMIERMAGGTELVLDYADMPYEVLVDDTGKEWKVNRYTWHANQSDISFGLFGRRYDQNDWNNNVVAKLTSLTLQGWTNKNVTDMGYMFFYCTARTLDLSNFNTSKVTNMNHMFEYCDFLSTLNLSNFNTSKVTDMSAMFTECTSLSTLNLSNFNTSKVTDMNSMFTECTSLSTLTLGENFNTSAVTDMGYMFYECTSLSTLNLSNFNTSKVTNMNSMFTECTSLSTLTLGENFNVPSNYSSSSKTNLAPSNLCTITMNNDVYNAFKQNDLASYTFDPTSWDASGKVVQEFTVTLNP